MGNSLLVEIAPYAEGPVEVNFDLSGFTEKLDELRDACK
jgi:invasion protein IalB